MKPYDFMDQMMKDVKMTANWSFWDLESPSDKEITDASISSREPVESASEASEIEPEGICLGCAFKELTEAQDNLSAEVYDLAQKINFLVKMLGGK